MFVCSGFQADSANSLIRWTFLKASAYHLRVSLRSHTNILHTDLERKWTPWPPDAILAFTSTEVTEFVSRPCYFTIIAILLGYPAKSSMEERGILVRSLFFQKNTISPRRSYNFKWQDIYVGVNFLSQVIFVFLLCLGMVMYANEVATKEK